MCSNQSIPSSSSSLALFLCCHLVSPSLSPSLLSCLFLFHELAVCTYVGIKQFATPKTVPVLRLRFNVTVIDWYSLVGNWFDNLVGNLDGNLVGNEFGYC